MSSNERAAQVQVGRNELNEKVVRDYMDCLKHRNASLLEPFWADDAVLEMPFAPEALAEMIPKRIEGAKAIVQWYRDMFVNAGSIDMVIDSIRPLQEPDVMLVENHEESYMLTGEKFVASFCTIIRLKEGKILHFKEFYDSLGIMASFGSGAE